MTLPLPYEKDLSNEEKQDIDSFIDSVYEQCKDDSKEITQLAMEASFGINAGKNRARELCRQGFFKNLLCNVTGKNRKIRGEIDRDFAVSQIASIKMIQKLAEHNKLTFEMIKNINLKLNCLVNEVDEEINQIYLQMNEFMKQVMDKFIEMSKRMERLESKVNIHDLVIFIKHHDINGVKFTDLNSNEKFLYFISEFFLTNKSLYIESDLMNLRYVMKEIGIESDDKISLLSIYDTLISNSSIADKFFLTFDKEKLNYIEDFKMPILGNINKIEKLENEEKYITDSVIEISGNDRKEVILNLLKNYSCNNLNMDLEKENSYFDLSISILGEMQNIDNLIIDVIDADDNFEEDIKVIEPPKYTRYEIALELLKGNKNIDAVLYLLNKAKDKGLDTAELYQLIGKVNLSLKKYDEAANNYKLSIEKGLNDYNNNYYTAMSLFFAKKYKEAKDYMIKALEIEPDNFEANLNLGVIYRVLENYNEAIKYYDEAIKINNKSDIAYINKAEAAARNKGNRNLIEGLLSIAISLNPEHKDRFKIENQFRTDLYYYLYYIIIFDGKKIEYNKDIPTIIANFNKKIIALQAEIIKNMFKGK
ncbi:tetratricopeptide repeat protein [Brachyspira pulli]|uniref:tetratricopeptide repeat protein n=1 Tax=Brachyspira pulli TaxID=310721 RepID=UPI003005D8A0